MTVLLNEKNKAAFCASAEHSRGNQPCFCCLCSLLGLWFPVAFTIVSSLPWELPRLLFPSSPPISSHYVFTSTSSCQCVPLFISRWAPLALSSQSHTSPLCCCPCSLSPERLHCPLFLSFCAPHISSQTPPLSGCCLSPPRLLVDEL